MRSPSYRVARSQLSVAKEFGLSAAQLATWINLPLLAMGLFSIPAGILVDRFGARAGVGFALLLMAVFALGRGIAPSFAWLCVATFAFGIGYAFLLSGMPKAVSQWFPPHELGRAVGFYTSGASIGVLTVFWFAIPVFGEKWGELFLTAGAIGTVAFLAWLVLGKRSSRASSGHGASGGVADMLRSFRSVASQRDVRLLVGLCAVTQIGVLGWLAFGFPYLVIAKGAAEETAGQVVAFTMVGFLFGALSVSGLSDRVGRRRPFLIGPALLTCLLFFGLIVVPLGWLFWAMVLFDRVLPRGDSGSVVRRAARATGGLEGPGRRVRGSYHLCWVFLRDRGIPSPGIDPGELRYDDAPAVLRGGGFDRSSPWRGGLLVVLGE